MSARLTHIDMDEETSRRFAFLLIEANANQRALGQKPFTRAQLAARLLQQILEDDAQAELPAGAVN